MRKRAYTAIAAILAAALVCGCAAAPSYDGEAAEKLASQEMNGIVLTGFSQEMYEYFTDWDTIVAERTAPSYRGLSIDHGGRDVVNCRGWLLAFREEKLDTQRFNIYAENGVTVLKDGKELFCGGASVAYDEKGEIVGNSYMAFGEKGRQLFLTSGNYVLTGTGAIRIEYMDAGYYDRVVEYYAPEGMTLRVTLGEYSAMESRCFACSGAADPGFELKPYREYTARELEALNSDEEFLTWMDRCAELEAETGVSPSDSYDAWKAVFEK